MTTISKPRPRTTPTWTRRPLIEWSAAAESAALKIDRDKKIIHDVKVLGRFSRNSHGLREAVNGTEYTPGCMKEALPLYEGAEVLGNHAAGGRERGIEDVIGVLRNCRVCESGIRADLHYYESHPMCGKLLEDAEKGPNGVLGLSHDAEAGRERFDRASGRLVIESLKSVKSVDLVRKPASNRNLWESQDVKKSFRELLEALTLTPVRQKWRKRLLEDGSMGAVMDAPVEAETGDAVLAGLKQAAMGILDDESLDAAGKIAKLKILLTTQEKLTQEAEPEEPVQESDEDDGKKKKDDTPDDQKTEALKVKVAKLEHEKAVRKLVETAGIKADPVLLESLEDMPIDKARKLIEREKSRGDGSGKPKSPGAPPPKTGGTGASDSRSFADRIRD